MTEPVSADEVALLRAVAADPYETTVRMAIADYWEEIGRPERAACVRENRPGSVHWVPDDPPGFQRLKLVWGHGFVESIVCPYSTVWDQSNDCPTAWAVRAVTVHPVVKFFIEDREPFGWTNNRDEQRWSWCFPDRDLCSFESHLSTGLIKAMIPRTDDVRFDQRAVRFTSAACARLVLAETIAREARTVAKRQRGAQ
jgi:uncharacterized protein (TIGR02996 family)